MTSSSSSSSRSRYVLVGILVCLTAIIDRPSASTLLRPRRNGPEVDNANAANKNNNGVGKAVGGVGRPQTMEVPAGCSDEARKMAHASVQFAWDSYLAQEAPIGRNVFYSPYSIMNAIGMLLLGSSGTTALQLQTALRVHPSLRNERLHIGLAEENAKLRHDDEATLAVANRFFVDLGAVPNVDPDYVTELSTVYNATMRRTTFAADPALSREQINQFISENTFGEIPNFLTSNPDPSTNIMLVNAIYFKGLWTEPFRPQFTTPMTFHSTFENVTVDMMYLRTTLPYVLNEELGCEMLCLSYTTNRRYALYVIQPLRGQDLPSVESRLNGEQLLRLQNSLAPLSVEIRFPKFALTNQLSLRHMLANLGAPDLFDPLRSDYSRMFVASRPGVIVDDIIHEAKVTVDEKGTVASAASAIIGIRNNPIQRSIFVDKPFLFFIADQSNGFILFWGRVDNPLQV